jgi:endonuclease/exonuclease/phosphatase family metal-dependent hydrolase
MLLTFLRKLTKRFFITANIVTVVLFILGCYSAYFNPTSFWFLGYLTIGAFYLFLLLVIFLLFWLFVKPKLAFISLVSFVCCLAPLRQIIKLRLPNFSMFKAEKQYRLMSWNVEHFKILEHKTNPQLKTQMVQLIKDYNPDVACFQEMVGSDSFPKAINYLPDIAQAIQMPYVKYSYKATDDFDGQHHFGNIIFSKYPIIDFKEYNKNDVNYNNHFMSVNIAAATDTFTVFNVHLQSLRLSKESLGYIADAEANQKIDIQASKSILQKLKHGFVQRKQQADNIATVLENTKYPKIVCGDFNDVPNSYAYTTIVKNLQNSFTKKGAGLGATFSGISPTLRIDNIFVDKAFTVQQYCRVKQRLSDHYPIFADISFN